MTFKTTLAATPGNRECSLGVVVLEQLHELLIHV